MSENRNLTWGKLNKFALLICCLALTSCSTGSMTKIMTLNPQSLDQQKREYVLVFEDLNGQTLFNAVKAWFVKNTGSGLQMEFADIQDTGNIVGTVNHGHFYPADPETGKEQGSISIAAYSHIRIEFKDERIRVTFYDIRWQTYQMNVGFSTVYNTHNQWYQNPSGPVYDHILDNFWVPIVKNLEQNIIEWNSDKDW